MSWPPNERERAIAEQVLPFHTVEPRTLEEKRACVAQLLADYREELLKPFDEMRRDFESMRDLRIARELDAHIKTARGKS